MTNSDVDPLQSTDTNGAFGEVGVGINQDLELLQTAAESADLNPVLVGDLFGKFCRQLICVTATPIASDIGKNSAMRVARSRANINPRSVVQSGSYS